MFFDPPQDFLLKYFSPLRPTILEDEIHAMTSANQLAPKQITNDNDSMTGEFYKNVYQKLSPKQTQTEDLRKQENI